MCKLPSRKLLATMVAGALFLPGSGYTLGLGEIEVNSALNQKFNADIELLSATPEDTESIIIKLASRKEFARAGLDRPYLLSDLRFKAETIDGAPHIKVTSGSPIREPFLNFLVEIDWPNGHLLREYTVLLDPPVFMTQSAARPAVSAPAANNQAASASGFRPSATATINDVPVAVPGPTPAAAYTQQSNTTGFASAPAVQKKTRANYQGQHRIKAGDTAWSLANAMRPDQSITPQQMMMALLRANPESFINENVNGLKRGYILRMPDYEQIVAISDQEARAMVKQQAALWREYLKSQAATQPVSALPAGDSEAAAEGAEAQGGGEAAVNEAYLEIVSAGKGSSSAGVKDPSEMTAEELRAELTLAKERVETERVEKEALQQRINILEQNAEKMKGLLAVEDEELSRVQSLGEPADSEAAKPATDSEVTAETVAETAVDTEAAVADTAESMTDDGAQTAAQETVSATEEVAADAEESAEEVAEEAVFADELGEQAESQQESGMAEEAQPVVDAAAPQAQSESRQSASLLTQLLNDPVRLATAGGGLLLIAALIGLVVRRRKAAENNNAQAVSSFEEQNAMTDQQAEEAVTAEQQSVAEVSAEQPDETQAESVETAAAESSEVAEAAEDVVTTAEAEEVRDDVIAEADVYLAYGIYQQAEDLLNRAINDNPERNDYRVKLAETYYTSKNVDAFVETASQLKERVDSEDSTEWNKVAVMGQDLCPDNPMFQSGKVEDIDIEDLATEEPVMDFDLDKDEPEAEIEAAELKDEAESETKDTLSMDSVDEIEFDLSDTGAVEEADELEDEFSLDIDASELDIDTGEEDSKKEAGSETAMDEISMEDELSLEEDLVADSPDNVIDLPAAAAETEQKDEEDEEVMLDLSDEIEIDSLDMEDVADTDATDTDIEAVAEEAIPEEDDEFDLSSLDDVDEISTKLDLARAYLDMGDHEGTRGILEEVLVDGNDEQKQEANELMAKLG